MSESDFIDLRVPDAPALIVTTGRLKETFRFADGEEPPRVSGLGAAVLVTRLRWWADHIEAATKGESA